MTVEIETIRKTDVKQKTELKKPKKWAIIFHNDDVTPMDFVVTLLTHIFNYDLDTAVELMKKIHVEGKGVVGVYPHEIAEQKKIEALAMIRANGQVLEVTMEEET